MATTPTRDTSEAALDQWNQAMRVSPLYQNFLKRNGLVDTGRGVTMSRAQQSALEDELEASGIDIPGGMHIDQGGNLNQKNRTGRNLGIAGGAALAAFGIPALAGAGAGAGAGGAAASGSGGLLSSTALGTGMAGLPTAVTGGASGASNMGIGSWLSNLFSGSGDDIVSNILSSAGKVATGAQAGRADARTTEAMLNQSQDRLGLSNAQLLENALMNRGQLDYGQQGLLENAKQGRAGIDLAQRNFALNAPSTRAGQSVRGDIMANAQDATVSHPRATIPQMTGGLKPSLFSENTRGLGREMSRKALADQMAGDTFEGMGDLPTFKAMPDATGYTPTALPSPTGTDTFLGTIGTAGTIWDLLRQAGLGGKEDEEDGNAATSALPGLFGNIKF